MSNYIIYSHLIKKIDKKLCYAKNYIMYNNYIMDTIIDLFNCIFKYNERDHHICSANHVLLLLLLYLIIV